MQLGEQVNGLLMSPEWRFVTSDAHDVCRRVREHDPRARLVGTPDGRVAVARFIERPRLDEDIEAIAQKPIDDRGGAWVLVFYPKRDGKPMVGEPDSTVLDQLRQRDLHARRHGLNERELARGMERVQKAKEEAVAEEQRERMRAYAEQAMFGWARKFHIPWRPSRIYVPSTVANGGGHRG